MAVSMYTLDDNVFGNGPTRSSAIFAKGKGGVSTYFNGDFIFCILRD